MELHHNIMLWDEIMEMLEDAEDDLRIQREVLTKKNPFLLSDNKFVKLFRLSKPLTQNLIEILTPHLQHPTRRSALSVETKVLATLRFLGIGSYQEITGSNHYIGISQPSMSRCIYEVCNALNSPEIFNNWVYFPRNIEELQNLRRNFYTTYQFPGVIGCVDCTHVAIIAPPVNDELHPERAYVNRKNYHSLNVQLICDNTLRIMNVNARFPGSVHDSYIWRHSIVSQIMERIYRRDPHNTFYLLGDSGYPTRPWLLTPILNPRTRGEERYNDRLCSVRSIIERCNGVLKNRFRCLLKHRVLHYNPTGAGRIINACVLLHNMCIAHGVPEPQEENEPENIDYGIYAPQLRIYDHNGRINNLDLTTARILQQNIINNNFL